MTRIFIQDVPCASVHAIRHRIDPMDLRRVAPALDSAGVDAIDIAHGHGLACGQASARTPAVPQQRPLLSQKPGRVRSGSPDGVTMREHRSTRSVQIESLVTRASSRKNCAPAGPLHRPKL